MNDIVEMVKSELKDIGIPKEVVEEMAKRIAAKTEEILMSRSEVKVEAEVFRITRED